MAKNFVQPGKVMTHTATGTVTSGQVLAIGALLGVALNSAVTGGAVEVAVEGVFEVPKVSTAVIAKGARILWDVSANSGAGAFDVGTATPATGDISGEAAVAWAAGANGQTTLLVKFTGVPGTVA